MSEFTRLYPTSGGLYLTIGSNYSIDEYIEVRSNICNYMYLYFVVENVILKLVKTRVLQPFFMIAQFAI